MNNRSAGGTFRKDRGKQMSANEFGTPDDRTQFPMTDTKRAESTQAQPVTKLLTWAHWQLIRGRFTAWEKSLINGAICGETICPKGCVLDTSKLTPELLEKLK